MMPLRFVLPFAALFLAPVAAAWSGGSTLDCASTERRTVHCPIDTRGGVALIRQHSRAACIEGHSWGWDRHGVWVSEGCRGQFVVGSDAAGAWYGHPGGHAGFPQGLRCESRDRQTVWCPIDTRHGVQLVRQLSRGPCIEGHSWGWDRRGVWVSQGCRAEFEAGGPRWAGPPSHWDRGPGWTGPPSHWDRGSGWASAPQLIRCESIGNRVQYCALGPIRSIRLHRQLSRSDCREGRSWGLDRGALWVTHGCRGEFAAW